MQDDTEVVSESLAEGVDRGAYLEVMTGAESGRRVALDGFEFVLGRGEGCDVRLQETSISRLHCKILARNDGRFVLHDLGSTNGTFVAGRALLAPVDLADGDLIRLGPKLTLRFGLPGGDRLEVFLFGAARARRGGEWLQHWKSQQVRQLLWYLALHWEGERGAETIVADLWPEAETGSVRNLLNPTVSYLRKALGSDFLERSPAGLRLRPGDLLWLDTREFVQWGRSARALESLDGQRAAQAYARQVELYQGPLLEGVCPEWALSFRYDYEAQWLAALRYLLEHCRDQAERRLDYARLWLRWGGAGSEAAEAVLESLLELERPGEVVVHFEALSKQLEREGLEISTAMLRTLQLARMRL